MFIVKNRLYFFVFTALLVIASIVSIFSYGLHLSTDFTGGALVQASYPAGRPAPEALQQSLDSAGFKGYSLREANTSDYILRSAALTTEVRQNIVQIMSVGGKNPATISQLTEVGPSIGAELKNKSIVALSLVLICILLFIAFAFRKVSRPISSWTYGSMAIVGLIHNVIVTLGFFALLGHFTGAQVDSLFVTAILTVLGFSIHDTIVVFDRTRENLAINHTKNIKEPFEETAGHSLNQTFVRSINTSLTVLITLLVLYFVGPASTKDFSLTLLVGIIAGTYSSIFLATPLLVSVAKWQERRRN